MNNSSLYLHWNYTTACCFKYKTKCVICPNQIVCAKFEDENKMHPIKYATMMTLKIIGKNGLEKFMEVDIW